MRSYLRSVYVSNQCLTEGVGVSAQEHGRRGLSFILAAGEAVSVAPHFTRWSHIEAAGHGILDSRRATAGVALPLAVLPDSLVELGLAHVGEDQKAGLAGPCDVLHPIDTGPHGSRVVLSIGPYCEGPKGIEDDELGVFTPFLVHPHVPSHEVPSCHDDTPLAGAYQSKGLWGHLEAYLVPEPFDHIFVVLPQDVGDASHRACGLEFPPQGNARYDRMGNLQPHESLADLCFPGDE